MDARRAREAASKNRAGNSANNSPPSEAWLFAQAILGNPVPDSARAESEARAANGQTRSRQTAIGRTIHLPM